MRLIEDLGMLEYGTQGKKARFGIYECPVCHKHLKCLVYNVNSAHTTKCNTCANRATNAVRSSIASNEFIGKAKLLHGNLYGYDLVEYVNNRTKIKINCKICDVVYEQTPSAHLSGSGCPHCADKIRNATNMVTNTTIAAKAAIEFADKARIVHGDKYSYDLVDYHNNRIKITITCTRCYSTFKQTPKGHLKGNGCPHCAEYGFSQSKPAIVYYIKITHNNTIAYKIGITNRTVQERFSSDDLGKITVIKTWSYLLGSEAYNNEQEILKIYKEFKYIGEPLLSSGNTELFTYDILNLDS